MILQTLMSGKKLINNPKVIVEIASTHGGSYTRLVKLVEEALTLGADCIKLQIFKNQYLCHNSSKYYSGLSKIEISFDKWEKIIKKYKSKIKIILEPFDEQSYIFCKKYKKDIHIKISSSESDNLNIIKDSLKIFKKVFINISGKKEKDIYKILNDYKNYKKKLVLLYGYQDFPTDLKKLRFKLIQKIKDKGFVVGYSDHSNTDNLLPSYKASLIAVMMGAKYLEKHFTINRKGKFPDFISSFEKIDFLDYCVFFKNLENYFDREDVSSAEVKYTNEMGKHAVAKLNLEKGEKINQNDILFLRTNKVGLTRQRFFKNTKFKTLKLKKNCKKNEILTNKHIIN